MSQIRHTPIPPTRTESYGPGDTVDRHRHDQHQLVYVSRGVVAIRTERGAWVASRDRAVWIPAGIWHEHRFYGICAFHTIAFPPAGSPLAADAPTVLAIDALARELLISCTDGDLAGDEARRMRLVLRDRLRRAAVSPFTLPVAQDPRLARACELVESRLDTPVGLPDLARAVHSGERTLSRLFRAEFAMTYPQWRTNVRLFHAMVALASGRSVTATAHACGWATTSAFVDTYRRALGHTPGRAQETLTADRRTPDPD